MSRGPTVAEAEGVAAEVSGMDPVIWPPPNAHPVDSELRMPTRPWVHLSPEEPSPGPPLPEGASTCEEELCDGNGMTPRKGGRRVQPVFRIIYTALGKPHEGTTLEPLRN